jgi:hypothetical protein
MEDRTNNNLMKLLKCLKSPDIVPPKQFLDWASKIMKSLSFWI